MQIVSQELPFLTLLLLVLLCGCKRGPGVQSESLHDLAREGDVKRIEALIARGMDVNQKDQHGDTPLHIAAVTGHVDVVQLLLRADADVNARDSNGDTPLHKAVWSRDGAVVELLFKNGADLNAVNKRGQTPAGLAMDGHRDEIARVLVAAGRDVPMNLVAYVGDTEKMKATLMTDANVNAHDTEGRTALYWAARRGHLATVVLLLRNTRDSHRFLG